MDVEGFSRLVGQLSSTNAVERAEAGRQLQAVNDWRACLAALGASSVPAVQFHALRLLRLLLLGPGAGAADRAAALERVTATLDTVHRSVRRECAFVVATLVKLVRPPSLPRDASVLAAVVTEMDFVRCGASGAPLAWHAAAHFAFQQEQLLRVAQQCVAAPVATPHLASLIDAVLSWSWAAPTAALSSASDARFAPSRWRPDPAWSQQLDWRRLLQLLAQVFDQSPHEAVYHALLRLCALRAGDVVGAHAAAFQSALAQTCFQLLRVGPDTVMSCHLLSKLVSSVSLSELLGGGGAALGGIVEFLMRALDVSAAEEFVDVADEVFSILYALRPVLALQPPFANMLVVVYSAFVTNLARKFPELPFEEAERMADVLLAAARVARLVAQPALAHVMTVLQENRQRAASVACVIRVAGFLLVDGAEGESDAACIPPELFPCAGAVTALVAAIQQRSQQLEDVCFWFFARWAPVYVAAARQSPFDEAYGKGLPAVRFLDGFLLDFLAAGLKTRAASTLPPLLFRCLCLAPSIGPMLIRSQKWTPLLALVMARLAAPPLSKATRRALLGGVFSVSRFFKTDAERMSYLGATIGKLVVALRGSTGALVRSLVSSVPPKLGLAASNCFFQLMAGGAMRSHVEALAALRRFLDSDLSELEMGRTFELVGKVFEGCAGAAVANAATREAACKQIVRCIERFGRLNWDGNTRQTIASLAWFWLCKMENVGSEALLSACMLAPALALANKNVLARSMDGSIAACVFEVRKAMNSDDPAVLEIVCGLLQHCLSNGNWTSAQIGRLASLLCLLSPNNVAACFQRVGVDVPPSLRPPLSSAAVEAALHQMRIANIKK
jgi:hypothetical protein